MLDPGCWAFLTKKKLVALTESDAVPIAPFGVAKGFQQEALETVAEVPTCFMIHNSFKSSRVPKTCALVSLLRLRQ